MDCKHAYFKDNIPYVLCDCDGTPRTARLDEVTKYMCGYQRFCPNIRACTLLPEWIACSKHIRHDSHVENVVPAVTHKPSRKKKA